MTRGRGAPPLEWRDQLIALVRSLYSPDVTAMGTAHFVQTVRLLLHALDRDVENIHEVIAGALRRRQQPPFVVNWGNTLYY